MTMEDVGMNKKKQKSEKRRRNKICPVRLTQAEFDLLEALSSSAGLSRAGFMRFKTLGSVGKRTQKRATPDQRDMAQFIGQLGKIGGNLTQINNLTKDGNTHGLDNQLVRDLLHEIQQIKEPISDMRSAWLKSLNKEF